MQEAQDVQDGGVYSFQTEEVFEQQTYETSQGEHPTNAASLFDNGAESADAFGQ